MFLTKRAIKLFLAMMVLPVASFTQVVVNEIQASNKTTLLDPDIARYSDWIELYNSGTMPADIGGYFLSDQRSQPTKWMVPAGTIISGRGYLIVWADEENRSLHTNFKLSSSGESVYLSNKQGVILDSVVFDYQRDDVSWGRIPDGSSWWGEMAPATPRSPNKPGTAIARLQKPVFSTKQMIFSTATSVSIGAEAGSEIRYTTDGSMPQATSSLYTRAITVGTSIVIKARAFAKDKQASDVAVQSVIVSARAFDLPIVSISTEHNWLYNVDTGIFMPGPHAEPQQPHYGANYWLDKEIPVHFEYITPDGSRKVSLPVGLKIKGGWTRMAEKKSFTVECDSKWGSSHFNYKFFNDKPQDRIKKLYLRNSGNDWAVTMFRDAYIHELTKRYMNIDVEAYQPAVLFINGEYQGIQNIRENLDKNYFKDNYGVDPDNIDLLEGSGQVIEGTADGYNDLINFISSNDLSVPAHYNRVKSEIDIDEYIDYQILQQFIANTDWPGNNIKYWREKKEGGKWRWVLFDTDFGLGLRGNNPSCYNALTFATDPYQPYWPNPTWSTLLLRKLLTNNEFKNKFIQRYAYQMNTTFSTQHMHTILDSLKKNIQYEMQYHVAYWRSKGVYWSWEAFVASMRSWADNRPSCVRDQISEYFWIRDGICNLTVNNDTSKGAITLGNQVIEPGHSGVYFTGIPCEIRAIPKKGYELKHWNMRQTAHLTTHDTSINLIAPRSSWKYLDDGSDQGTTWQETSFDDTAWKEGPGPLGNNESVINTTVDYKNNTKENHITTYFRHSFTLDSTNLSGATLKLMRGDGAVVYINGVEVARSNMPEGNTSYTTVASGGLSEYEEYQYIDIVLSPNALNAFVSGKNTITVEVHQSSKSSSDLSFDLALDVSYLLSKNIKPVRDSILLGSSLALVMTRDVVLEPVYKKSYPLVITEILNQTTSTTNQYVEILNTGNFDIDAGGLLVSGDISHVFPAGFIIKQHESVLLCKNSASYPAIAVPKASWNKGTLAGSGSIAITDTHGDTVDMVQYSNTAPWPVPGASPGRSIYLIKPSLDNNQGNNWQLSPPDRNSPGGMPFAKKITGLFINECMSDNTASLANESGSFDDWIELYNSNDTAVDIGGLFLSDDPAEKLKCRLPDNKPSLTTIPAHGFLILWADNNPSQGALHLDFNISKQGETIYLSQLSYLDTLTIDQMTIAPAYSNKSFGRYPDGAAHLQHFIFCSPQLPNNKQTLALGLHINEVMPFNKTYADNMDETDAWVEIFNSTSYPINLAGLYLTNDSKIPLKWMIPTDDASATTVPGLGYHIVWLDGQAHQGALHASFSVKNDTSGAITLIQRANNINYQLSTLYFHNTDISKSVGMFPDGSLNIKPLSAPTPGQSNTEPMSNALSNDKNTTIYPVPLQDILTITTTGEHLTVRIFDIQGTIILVSSSPQVDVSSLAPGIYIIESSTSLGSNKWLVVKH